MLPSPDQIWKLGRSVGIFFFFFFFLRTVRELSFPIFFLKFLNGENSGRMQSKRIYKSCKCFFKPLNTNFSKFFAQIWHKKKKKKKKTRPCFFAFYGRSGEGNINFFFFGLIPLPHYEYFFIFEVGKKMCWEFPSYTAEPVRTASANITARTIGTTLIMGKVSGCDILTLAVYFLYPSLFIPRLPTLWYFGRLLTHLHLEQSINVEELRFCVGVEDEGKVTEREGTAILKKKIDDEIENT